MSHRGVKNTNYVSLAEDEELSLVHTGKIYYTYVSNKGNVYHRRVKDNSVRHITLVRGYHRTTSGARMVKIGDKEYLVKELVAKAFLSRTYEEGMFIEHIDGDPDNCEVDNLRLVSRAQHFAEIGKNTNSVPVICTDCLGNVQTFESYSACARALYWHPATIRKICIGEYTNNTGYQYELKR